MSVLSNVLSRGNAARHTGKRRHWIYAAVLASLGLNLAVLPAANAQDAASDYPNRLVTVLVGYGPGGGSDILARLLADNFFPDKKPKVIVENKPGAEGRIAGAGFAKEPADGYHLMVAGPTVISMAKALYPNLAYDPVKDFKAVSIIASTASLVLVVLPSHPAKTLQELVDWTKANPDASNYATSGPNYTIPTEQLKLATGMKGQAISYRSGNELITAVLGGHTTYVLADPALALPLIADGKLRALGVTGEKRMDALKDIKTFKEYGYVVTQMGSIGVFVPAATPDAIVKKIENEVKRIVNIPKISETIVARGLVIGGNTSDEFRQQIVREVTEVTKAIADAGLKFEQ